MTRESGLKPSKPMSIRHPSRQECIDAIPRHAYRLGIDGDGRTHYHAAGTPHRVWVVEDGEVIHRQGLGSESITAWIGHVVEEHYGWEERERVEQPASGRSARRDDCRGGSTRDVPSSRASAPERAAIDCARVPIVTSADVLPPTPERDHWMLEVVVEAVAVPATVLDALANAELSVRDISPQGQTRVVEAVA